MDCSGPNDSPLGCDVGEVVGGLVGGLVGGGVGGGVGAGVGLGVGAPSVFVYDERIPLLDRFGPTMTSWVQSKFLPPVSSTPGQKESWRVALIQPL